MLQRIAVAAGPQPPSPIDPNALTSHHRLLRACTNLSSRLPSSSCLSPRLLSSPTTTTTP
ncbi:hypothetical protein Syun_013878 [Stephania yunnanensis]|uniref:Uncharacterized protein n=1 Tax=Stephania yunnanensis TaxID=152371 RepID=A0AAP0JI64_9MAGN